MTIHQTKNGLWLTAGAIGAGLITYVALGLQTVEPTLTDAKQREVLDGSAIVEPTAARDEIVAYASIEKGFFSLNWTGKPPPEKPVEQLRDPTAKPAAKPVDDLLDVVFLWMRMPDSDKSAVLVKMVDTSHGRPGQKASSPKDPLVFVVVGERLPEPNGNVHLVRVEPDAAVFGFDDAERAEERVILRELALRGDLIVMVGPDGAIYPAPDALIPVGDTFVPFNPEHTISIGRNAYQVGWKDGEYLEKNWSSVIANEVRHAPHRDPTTGKYDGIEIKEVKEGSLAASFGVQSGDVIKSVNGHPVSTVNEAVSFAKANNAKYDKWEIVVENMGKTKTITYLEPPPKP